MEDIIPLKNIEELHFPDDRWGTSCLLVGSTKSGKTTMLNYLYDTYFKKHITTVMSTSLNSDTYDYIKQYAILSDLYHPELIKDMYNINHATKNEYQFCIVLDDMNDIKNDKEYRRLLTCMRNQRCSCIVSAQGVSMFDKTCRGNINIVILGRMNSDAEVKKVVEEYLISYFPKNISLGEKITLYRQLTDNHFFIILEQVEGNIFRTKLRPEQMLND